MRIGKCVKRDFGYLGCQSSVLHYLDTLCSGRRDCSFQIPDQTLRDMRPCSELESYLEASYSCLHGKGFFLSFKEGLVFYQNGACIAINSGMPIGPNQGHTNLEVQRLPSPIKM